MENRNLLISQATLIFSRMPQIRGVDGRCSNPVLYCMYCRVHIFFKYVSVKNFIWELTFVLVRAFNASRKRVRKIRNIGLIKGQMFLDVTSCRLVVTDSSKERIASFMFNHSKKMLHILISINLKKKAKRSLEKSAKTRVTFQKI
jgi:hypothetical protein